MNEILAGLLGMLIGGFIGHRLSLGRDRRKEHNAAVLPLKQKVLEYIDLLKKSEHLPFVEKEIKVLRGIVSERKYDEVKRLYNEFISLIIRHGEINEIGYVVYSKKADIEISNKLRKIEKILSLK